MNPYISALVGLLGVLIGSLTSFGTTWLTQSSQARDKYREGQVAKREDLFVKFINEATRLYADALSNQKDDVSDLVLLYAMIAQMRLLCTRPVIDAAETVITNIIETYLAPNRTLHQIQDLASSGAMNFLTDFGEASRVELATIS